MRGNVNWQVQEIFKKSGINHIGQSKHTAKNAARISLKEENRPDGWHNIGKAMGIHSYSTADAYRDVWRQLGHYVRSVCGEKNMEKITGEHVQSYLESRTIAGVAHATFLKEAAACEKLEVALNGFAEKQQTGNNYAFSDYVSQARVNAHEMLQRFNGCRAYDEPERLIEAITNPLHQLVARMQFESGVRVSEASHLSQDNLKGIVKDPATGDMRGCVYVTSAKGGIDGEKYVSPETYRTLEKEIQSSSDGRFIFSKNDYRDSLKKASRLTGQGYNASHGLRWNFARSRFQEVQRCGQGYEQALQQVSQEMFHQRADITEHYLK